MPITHNLLLNYKYNGTIFSKFNPKYFILIDYSLWIIAVFQALDKMKSDWKSMDFNFVPYKDSKISILSAFDDIQVLLDDHIVKTTTMKGSPFIGPFEEEVNEWDQLLVISL